MMLQETTAGNYCRKLLLQPKCPAHSHPKMMTVQRCVQKEHDGHEASLQELQNSSSADLHDDITTVAEPDILRTEASGLQ
jgi:hypothetical protein